jgi:hypothetical protein
MPEPPRAISTGRGTGSIRLASSEPSFCIVHYPPIWPFANSYMELRMPVLGGPFATTIFGLREMVLMLRG